MKKISKTRTTNSYSLRKLEKVLEAKRIAYDMHEKCTAKYLSTRFTVNVWVVRDILRKERLGLPLRKPKMHIWDVELFTEPQTEAILKFASQKKNKKIPVTHRTRIFNEQFGIENSYKTYL